MDKTKEHNKNQDTLKYGHACYRCGVFYGWQDLAIVGLQAKTPRIKYENSDNPLAWTKNILCCADCQKEIMSAAFLEKPKPKA